MIDKNRTNRKNPCFHQSKQVSNFMNETTTPTKKESKLLTGFRSDLDYYVHNFLQKNTQVLFVSDTNERAYLNFRSFSKLTDRKVLLLTEAEVDYLEVVQKHQITIMSGSTCAYFLQKDFFSLQDFKVIILDDCNDLLHENSIFKVLIDKFNGQILGLTTNYETFEAQYQYFEKIEDIKNPLQLNYVPITEKNIFKTHLISLMQSYELITLNFLKNLSLHDYPYGTLQYEQFLKNLIVYSSLENKVNLNYCLHKLKSVNNAILVTFYIHLHLDEFSRVF